VGPFESDMRCLLADESDGRPVVRRLSRAAVARAGRVGDDGQGRGCDRVHHFRPKRRRTATRAAQTAGAVLARSDRYRPQPGPGGSHTVGDERSTLADATFHSRPGQALCKVSFRSAHLTVLCPRQDYQRMGTGLTCGFAARQAGRRGSIRAATARPLGNWVNLGLTGRRSATRCTASRRYCRDHLWPVWNLLGRTWWDEVATHPKLLERVDRCGGWRGRRAR